MKPFVGIRKLDLKGAWLRSHDGVSNFGTPFISWKWLKIETSHLVHASNITGTSQCTTNWPLKWVWSGSRDQYLKVGFLSITYENIKQHNLKFVSKYTLSAAEKFTSKWAWLGSRDPFEEFWNSLYLRNG